MKADFALAKRRFRALRWAPALSVSLFGLCVALALGNQVRLLDYLEWGDESETIVAARMLASGMSLYSQVFNHHGPFAFFPGWLLELFGHFGVRGHRVVIAVLQVAALFAVYASPLLRHLGQAKLLVMPLAITAVVLLLPKSELHGQTYTYQVLAGLLLMAVLAQYTLPSMLAPASILHRHVFWGNAALACLPWLAVTYLPIAVLVFACSLRRGTSVAALVGAASGTAANFAFLVSIGSFAGFMADHIYLNSQILPTYNGGQGAVQLIKSVVLLPTDSITIWFAIVGIIMALGSLLGRTPRGSAWRFALLAAALGSLLMRGLVNHGATFWYAVIAVATIAAAMAVARISLTGSQRALGLAASTFCVLQLLYPLASRGAYADGKRAENTEFGWIAQQLTGPDDKIIAYSFQNFEYLAADRLPASGHFFYLPWQAAYNEHPKFGIVIDACHDISISRPKLILLDKWKVWNRYSWDGYAGCIQSIVDRDYTQLPDRPVYVRNDLFERASLLHVPTGLHRSIPE